uniref:Integrase zinc-binding domain-containing protein n=1 Tax=Pavo cristatus TaxID=9049 RepID=A0A8C9FVA5_PAVCR
MFIRKLTTKGNDLLITCIVEPKLVPVTFLWLHVKRGHTGALDLYRETQARGWPVTREQCRTCISACDQCRMRLGRHPLQDAPLHLREGKHLWETWQIDYIG